MTDFRATLEAEAQKRARLNRLYRRFVKAMIVVNVVAAVVLLLKHASLGEFVQQLAPLLALVGLVAGYSPKHRAALDAAIADPDPALDHDFAQTLASYDPAIFDIGREAFRQRFKDRRPELDDAEWRTVALSLLRTRERDAALMLSLLAGGAGASAIEPIEGFSSTTKNDRLKTLARQTLAEIRLRAARERIVEHEEAAERRQDEERQRLRI